LSILKETNLCDCGSWVNGVWEWNLRWRRVLFAWEEDQVSQLLEIISEKKLEVESKVRWVWKDSETTTFSVKSTYRSLRRDGEEEVSRLYNFF